MSITWATISTMDDVIAEHPHPSYFEPHTIIGSVGLGTGWMIYDNPVEFEVAVTTRPEIPSVKRPE